jgi:hypothetical protein
MATVTMTRTKQIIKLNPDSYTNQHEVCDGITEHNMFPLE